MIDRKMAELCRKWHVIEASTLFQRLASGALVSKEFSQPQTGLHGLIPPPYLIQTPVTKIQWSVKAPKHNYMTSVWTSDAVTLDTLLYWHSRLEREFGDFCSVSQNRISPLLLFRPSKRSSKYRKHTFFHVQHFFSDLQTHQTNSRCRNTHTAAGGG